MSDKRMSISLRHLFGLIILVIALFGHAQYAKGQEIVTDLQLNQRLLAFLEKFPNNPQIPNGATLPFEIKSTAGNISFTFSQRGDYVFDYGNLEFAPTTPISANRFVAILDIVNVHLVGSGAIKAMIGRKSFDFDCVDNQFTVGPIVFMAEVEVLPSGEVVTRATDVNFDPATIGIKVPCLDEAESAALARQLAIELRKINPLGNKPPKGKLKKIAKNLMSSVTMADSSVSKTSSDTAKSTCMAIITTGASACGDQTIISVKNTVTELAALSNSANAADITASLKRFADSLRQRQAGLSPIAQASMSELINTIASAAEDGRLSQSEQGSIVTALFNLTLNPGINIATLETVSGDLITALSATGDLMKLQMNLQQLLADAAPCARAQ